MADADLILVHGLWHGRWAWDQVRPRLDDVGVTSIAAELPLTSLDEDVAAVRWLLDVARPPTVLVGHSYGGAVITVAGSHPAVSELVYLAGFALDEGESVSRTLPSLGIPPTGLGAALRFSADGQDVTVADDLAADLLYGHSSAEQAAAAIKAHRPVRRALFGTPVSTAAWRQIASTYVVCADDRAVAPQLQRAMATRAATSVEWPSDHTPALSHPDLVADLLVAAVRDVAGR